MSRRMRTTGVLVGGGPGFGSGSGELLRAVEDRPLLFWGVEALRSMCDAIAVVVPLGAVLEATDLLARHDVTVVEALATRALSVRAAIDAMGQSDLVVTHDARRPFASRQLLRKVLVEASSSGAAACAVHCSTTMVEVDDSERIVRLTPMHRVREVQTPQAFVTGLLYDSLGAMPDSTQNVEEATAVVLAGGLVQLVEGEVGNRLLAHPEDFDVNHAKERP